jgi:hypothetical protein
MHRFSTRNQSTPTDTKKPLERCSPPRPSTSPGGPDVRSVALDTTLVKHVSAKLIEPVLSQYLGRLGQQLSERAVIVLENKKRTCHKERRRLPLTPSQAFAEIVKSSVSNSFGKLGEKVSQTAIAHQRNGRRQTKMYW